MRLSLALERRTLAMPGGNARTAWRTRETVLVRVGDGPVGQGEAAPIPGHSRETADEAWADLARLGGAIEVEDPGADVGAWLGESSRACEVPSSRFALETALLDWVGLERNVPAHVLLGGSLEVLALAAVAHDAGDAARLAAEGYRHLKVKVDGTKLEGSLDSLRLLRRSMADVALRLDLNRTLTDPSPRILASFAELSPEFVEEPCGVGIPLPSHSPVPLAIDESIADDPRWLERVADGGFRVVVLKPSVVGGVARSLELARVVRRLGAEVVASYGWEGVVGWAGACAVARAIGGRLAPGLAPHHGIAAEQAVLRLVRHGRLFAPSSAGLGLTP